MTAAATVPAVEHHSVVYHAAADYAAQKHLDWERLRYDVHETASEHWRKRYWRLWFRARWVEHLLGQKYWVEMGEDNFALLTRSGGHHPVLLDRIADRLIIGGENLNVIPWAHVWGLDVAEVILVLTAININHVRVNNKPVEEFWGPLIR